MNIEYHPVGIIHSPFKDIRDMPIQPGGAAGIQGRVDVLPDYAEGLKDVEGFSHIILLYHFHLVTDSTLSVIPFLDTESHGIFATRAPKRPNPLGLSVVKLLRREGTTLYIENVDIVDGTPLLDIKPYVPEFDHHPAERIGWVEKAQGRLKDERSDDRFI